MTTQVNIASAHTIRLTYSGYGKFIATWKGYEKNTIRKTIHVDSSYEFSEAGLEAAQMFAQWLTDTSSHALTRNKCIVESITMGELSADKRVLLVRTDWIEGESV